MNRTTDTFVTFAVSFLLGYAVAATLRDRAAGLRVGFAVGGVVALLTWLGYERPEALDPAGDADAEPIEIEI